MNPLIEHREKTGHTGAGSIGKTKWTQEKDLIIEKNYAKIEQIEITSNNENVLRVYCVQFPDAFSFQIRTYSPIVQGGKFRNMIATVNLTINEVEQILAYMKAHKDAYKVKGASE